VTPAARCVMPGKCRLRCDSQDRGPCLLFILQPSMRLPTPVHVPLLGRLSNYIYFTIIAAQFSKPNPCCKAAKFTGEYGRTPATHGFFGLIASSIHFATVVLASDTVHVRSLGERSRFEAIDVTSKSGRGWVFRYRPSQGNRR